MAQAVDFIVDRGVLLNEGIAGRHIGLGLVVVVVGDKVFNPVFGKELPKFVC
ncbi:unannotated protein [freshwater metagenome]|uniref:Unannotated protein n=1 Tax=freshwater metagenome TaxID=449393 RepID=A0A6J6UT64_9ZZZZ